MNLHPNLSHRLTHDWFLWVLDFSSLSFVIDAVIFPNLLILVSWSELAEKTDPLVIRKGFCRTSVRTYIRECERILLSPSFLGYRTVYSFSFVLLGLLNGTWSQATRFNETTYLVYILPRLLLSFSFSASPLYFCAF